MKTRSSDNWNCKAGSQNYLNTDFLFDSDLKYGMPPILKLEQKEPANLDFVPCQHYHKGENKGVHFFTEDHFNNAIWNIPLYYAEKFSTAHTVFTPDFSPYEDYPEVLQIFNIYRSRYITRFFQQYQIEYGNMNIIPYINHNGGKTMEYAFAGVEKGMMLSISTVGRFFDKEPFKEFISELQPTKLYCYGKKDADKILNEFENVVFIETFMQSRTRTIKRQKLLSSFKSIKFDIKK